MINRIIVIACAILAGLPMAAQADFQIIKIADTSTPLPGGRGNFTSFGLPSADRENPDYIYGIRDFYFQANTANGSGIYDYDEEGTDRPIYAVVETTMAAPTGGNYASFSNTSSGYGNAGWIATTTDGTQLVMEGSPLGTSVVAKTGDSPAPGKTFGSFQNISIMGTENYDPAGEIESDIGIYHFNFIAGRTWMLIGDTSTIPPGASSPFASFGPISYKAGRGSTIRGFGSDIQAIRATVGGVEGIYYGSGNYNEQPAGTFVTPCVRRSCV